MFCVGMCWQVRCPDGQCVFCVCVLLSQRAVVAARDIGKLTKWVGWGLGV